MASPRLDLVSRRSLFAAIGGGVVLAAMPSPARDAQPAIIGGAVEYAVTSANGGAYRILVWQPPGAVPAEGFPVLYAFDGDDLFGMAVDFARSLAPAARRAGVRPAMVVAIGYPPGDGGADRRTYDLSLSSDDRAMPERPNGKPWPKLGGGEAMLGMIVNKVKPLVASQYPIDTGAETLFGHSLGGLMTLHAFALDRMGIERFFASSPSIWVDGRRILGEISARLSDGISGTLRMTVGSREEELSDWDLRSDFDIEARQRWIDGNRMVGNARDLAAMFDASAVDFSFEVLDGHDHRTSLAVALQKALMLAMNGR